MPLCGFLAHLRAADVVGAWPVSPEDVLQGRLPIDAAQVPLRAAALPPERVPVWHSVPLAARRGEGLATRRHHQTGATCHLRASFVACTTLLYVLFCSVTDSAWHPRAAGQPKPEGPRASRGLHHLHVRWP